MSYDERYICQTVEKTNILTFNLIPNITKCWGRFNHIGLYGDQEILMPILWVL